MRRLLLLVFALLLLLPALGQAQVRRCELPGGGTVYTDQACDLVGGRERLATAASAPQLRSYRPACSRTLRDLAYEVTAAVQAHDVNRLAATYLWNGMGTREGYALMARLQRVVDRPLVDLQPIWPGGDDGSYYPGTAPARPPVGLRLQQTSPRGSTPIQAVFGLRKHLDCWWIVEGGVGRKRAPASPTPARPVWESVPYRVEQTEPEQAPAPPAPPPPADRP